MKILILDYSTDRSEAPAIERWMPSGYEVTTLFIDQAESFPDDLISREFTHVIHSGSALTITRDASFTTKAVAYIHAAREAGVSQMGICYGHQLLCRALVGKHAVRRSPNGLEAGWLEVRFDPSATRIPGVRQSEIVWQHHFDEVIELPPGSEILASNSHCPIQGFINQRQHLFGTQFHPEIDHQKGNKIFRKDRRQLETHGYNVDLMVEHGPSLDTGRVFFNFFLNGQFQPA